jgi:hypothetical protein
MHTGPGDDALAGLTWHVAQAPLLPICDCIVTVVTLVTETVSGNVGLHSPGVM